jgi:hypothetical protein
MDTSPSSTPSTPTTPSTPKPSRTRTPKSVYPKLSKSQLSVTLGDKKAGVISAKRSGVISQLQTIGRSSKDPGWKYLASLSEQQVAILIGGHVETLESAIKKLAAGGARPDRKSVLGVSI